MAAGDAQITIAASEAAVTWAEYVWPEWVPEEVRTQVESFWAESWGRGPRAWLRDYAEQGAPAFGSVVTLGDGFSLNAPKVTGRYVHAWNNIGRIVLDDGTFAYTSFNSATVGSTTTTPKES
jgi:hypothetical protein